MTEEKQYLTVDIGGTFIKYSILDGRYRQMEEGSERTKREPEEFLMQLLAIVGRYKERVSGIAACIGGFIDPETGENTDFSVGKNFVTYNLKEEFAKASGLPVVLENDSNSAALGELVAGAGRGLLNLGMITVGTGIGGALIIDRKLVRGSHFKAGEAGFFRLGIGTDAAPLEYAAATSRLVKKVSAAVGETVDGYYIFEHLDDPAVGAVYRDWLAKLAVIVGNMAVLTDPEAVLIGGGICKQERFIRDLREKVYSMYEHLEEYTQIRACETGNLAGRIGALSLLLGDTA